MSISPYRKHPSPNIHAPVFKQATKIDALMLLVLFIVQCTVLLTVLAVLLWWSASIIMHGLTNRATLKHGWPKPYVHWLDMPFGYCTPPL
jgi:hypothetical protein